MDSLRTHYLISNDRDIDWGIYATTTGSTSYPAGSVYPHSYHPPTYYFNPQKGRVLDDYMLVYITRGKGFLQTKTCGDIALEEGDLFLIMPEEWHTYWPSAETGWDEYWIGFRGDFFNQLNLKGFISRERPVWKTGIHSGLISLFEQAISLANSQYPAYQQMMSGLIVQMLSQGYYLTQSDVQDNYVIQYINKAKSIMIQHIEDPIHPEEIARMLNVSYSWFRSHFKRCTHFSPVAYQQELKIERAKTLLLNSGLSIKEIAEQLNFSSVANFTTLFKAKTGKTPAFYRR